MQEAYKNAAYDTDFINISRFPGARYMKVIWLRPVTSKEYRAGTELSFHKAKSCSIHHLLINASKANAPSVADQNWTVKFINTIDDLSVTRLALLLSQDIFQSLAVEKVESRLNPRPYELQLFTHEDEAVEWLFS